MHYSLDKIDIKYQLTKTVLGTLEKKYFLKNIDSIKNYVLLSRTTPSPIWYARSILKKQQHYFERH